MAKPNLFEYAPSELSQDAVLCWLAAWARPEAAAEDHELHQLGLRYVGRLLETHGRSPIAISSLEVKRQYKGIDVLLLINNGLAVCIEDKAGTTERSNQLVRYVEMLRSEGHAPDDIVPIYVQTFEQGNYRAVEAAGYATVSRKALLAVLEPYAILPSANAIVRDFYDRLNDLDRDVDSFRHKPLANWTSLAWRGFYRELQARLGNGDWGYVANPTGGFDGYWWHGRDITECRLYLQLEQILSSDGQSKEGTLCFKISVEHRDSRSRIRGRTHARLLEVAQRYGLEVVRPRRFGHGATMTVGLLVTDYRVTDGMGRLDLEATVTRLRRAEVVLEALALNEAGASALKAGIPLCRLRPGKTDHRREVPSVLLSRGR